MDSVAITSPRVYTGIAAATFAIHRSVDHHSIQREMLGALALAICFTRNADTRQANVRSRKS
ncbi:hypothetical protein [Bradyrhizobium sp. JYMT SZCCT0428]|uniref:hypothetical protein n=1 Tax=Bradyrhizobium sp. JYMT SZCCT0428 TaxID=2807673 RepID=UPI001BAC1E27|nr:hypothetical protein [Bradyrhizobium sp. JYMT SZCCT0428]MBR1151561.1 hypothetical protein [Bradyrhizobium sp. JYMT SZCCT0428]